MVHFRISTTDIPPAGTKSYFLSYSFGWAGVVYRYQACHPEKGMPPLLEDACSGTRYLCRISMNHAHESHEQIYIFLPIICRPFASTHLLLLYCFCSEGRGSTGAFSSSRPLLALSDPEDIHQLGNISQHHIKQITFSTHRYICTTCIFKALRLDNLRLKF